MSMYGAHVTTRNIRGEARVQTWNTYGSWAGCFAGLSTSNLQHLRDDHTAIATIALSNRTRERGVSKHQEAQRAFLFGEFCQRLTDSAFIAWELPEPNTPVGANNYTWGGRDSHVSSVINSAQLVHFNPHRHQDLLVTAFRISKQCNHADLTAVHRGDLEFWPLATAIKGSDGYAYSDSAVIFGTPYAQKVIDFVGEKYDGDFDDMYDDDIGDEFDGEEFTKLTVDGLEDMLKRTTGQFRDYCRQGMGDLICGYTKDVELGRGELEGMRPDDPIGLAAPMRFIKRGGRFINDLRIPEIVGIIKEIMRG